MNGILYRALVGRFDSNEPECFVFFECPPLLHPATELARLLARGAAQADVGQGEQDWIVLVDPEGNELCLLDEPVT